MNPYEPEHIEDLYADNFSIYKWLGLIAIFLLAIYGLYRLLQDFNIIK